MALVQANVGPRATQVNVAGGENPGFRHFEGYTAPTDGTDPAKITKTYPSVTGVPVGFYVRTAVNYEAALAMRAKGVDPKTVDVSTLSDDQTQMEAALRLKDPITGEIVAVNFNLHTSEGGQIVGLLNSLRMQDRLGEDISLRAWAKTGKFYMCANSAPGEAKHPDLLPTYVDDDGAVLLTKEDRTTKDYVDGSGKTVPGRVIPAGSPAGLPMGVVVAKVKNKDVWSFEERDQVISATALACLDAYTKPSDANKEEGVDFSEAAKAAAPAP